MGPAIVSRCLSAEGDSFSLTSPNVMVMGERTKESRCFSALPIQADSSFRLNFLLCRVDQMKVVNIDIRFILHLEHDDEYSIFSLFQSISKKFNFSMINQMSGTVFLIIIDFIEVLFSIIVIKSRDKAVFLIRSFFNTMIAVPIFRPIILLYPYRLAALVSIRCIHFVFDRNPMHQR